MRSLWIALAGALITVGASAQTPAELRLAGASEIGRQLAPDLLAAFAASAPGLQPSVVSGGTGAGLAALAEGRADIAMASRQPTDDERVMLLLAGLGDPAASSNGSVVALEGLVVAVNRDNAIGILTLDQIQRLFTGQIGNWSALGGRDLPVTIYGADPVARDDAAVMQGQGVADAVAADPGGVGFIDPAAPGEAKPVTIALACGLTAAPKPFAMRTEEYPLTRRLTLYSAASKPALVQEFLRFALSAAAQPMVRRAGLIDLTPELAQAGDGLPRAGLWDPADAKHRRDILERITHALAGARRLSTTFRFEPDGTVPDRRAWADFARVTTWLHANPGRKLILLGYANGPATFDGNLAQSARLAQIVARGLAASGAVPEQVLAGGTLRPATCDDDAGGGRRVEVWVR